MLYYRLTKGLVDKGKLYPITENVYKHITQNHDWYKSVYYYTEEQKKTFYEKTMAKGYKKGKDGQYLKDKDGNKIEIEYETIKGAKSIHDVVTDHLVFDIDINKDNMNDNSYLELSKSTTLILCDKLIAHDIPKDALQIGFSGGKGFSVDIKLNGFITPEEHRRLALEFVKDIPGADLDTKMYNASRVWRIPYTKHQKTGLYKIPLTFDELKTSSIQEIKDLASQEYEPVFPEYLIAEVPEIPEEDTSPESQKDDLSAPEQTHDLDLTKKPKWLSNWKYALTEGYFPPGSRNAAYMILAATYKGQGFSRDATKALLSVINQKQSKLHDQKIFPEAEIERDVLFHVYSDTWQGGTYSEDNFPREITNYFRKQGIPSSKPADVPDVVSIDDTMAAFTEYAKNIDKNTIRSGIKSLDNKIRFMVGNLYALLAPPGLGKSSSLITLINNMSLDGHRSLFFSYDMHKAMIVQKLIQRHTKYTDEEIYAIYKNNNTKEINNFRQILKKHYSNVTFCFKSGQSIDAIKRTIRETEDRLGERIPFIGVDYSELIIGSTSDPTQLSKETIQGLREIAIDMNKCVFVLLQPNKMSSKPNEPATSYNAAKGSSSIAQAVTAMITAHRPGYGTDQDDYFSINCVKSRMGALFALDFHWDGRTGRIRDLEEPERLALMELRDRLKEEKEAEKGKGFSL